MRPVIEVQKVTFTEEQLALLERMFPVLEITPEVPVEQVMYSAGQQKVLARIKERTQGYQRVQL